MSNIKELIREKIDAFYTEYKAKFHQNGDSYHLGIIDGLDMAERILDTLPDEPVTDCHDLTEAAIDFADYARKALYSKDYAISSIADYDHGCIDGFKAGAKWGAEHLRDATKKISEDLEEAARECSKTIYNKPLSGNPQEGYIVYDPDKYDAFKAGAEWATNQGVKTTGTISPRGIIYDTNVGYHLFLERYLNGDKVEIQIRKI